MKVSSKRNKVFGLIVLILLVVLLNAFQKEVRSFFYSFSAPIQKVLWEAGESTSDFFEGLLTFASLKNQLDTLEQEKQGLISEILRLKELEEENISLRQALDIELEEEYDLSFAQIISKDISEDIILIDKGYSNEMAEGMTVITGNKLLVGRIIEVFNNYSKVMLISHKDLSFDVKIKQEEKEISAVASGQGNSNILLNFIPREEEILPGDIISTSRLGGIFPECLLIGEIEEINRNDVDPFQVARIKSVLDIKELRSVFIITND